jgi:hypothetical protein
MSQPFRRPILVPRCANGDWSQQVRDSAQNGVTHEGELSRTLNFLGGGGAILPF